MSLEEVLIEHTAALKENTEALKAVNAGRAEALAGLAKSRSAEPAAEADDQPKRSRGRPRKDEPKATETVEETAEEEVVETKKPTPTVADLKAVAVAYTNLDEDEEAIQVRRTEIKKFAKTKFGMDRAVDIPEESRAEFIEWVNKKIAAAKAAPADEDDEI